MKRHAASLAALAAATLTAIGLTAPGASAGGWRSPGLPQHVFCRFTGESKPIYADLTSLASVDLISRSLRRARRKAGADASVTVVEMLPPPDEAWLTDGRGQRYTAELRMVAVDQKMSARRQEG